MADWTGGGLSFSLPGVVHDGWCQGKDKGAGGHVLGMTWHSHLGGLMLTCGDLSASNPCLHDLGHGAP